MSKGLVFMAGLAVALGAPVVLGAANDVLGVVALVLLYAALGGVCAWLLAGVQRRPLGVGLLVGGGLFVLRVLT